MNPCVTFPTDVRHAENGLQSRRPLSCQHSLSEHTSGHGIPRGRRLDAVHADSRQQRHVSTGVVVCSAAFAATVCGRRSWRRSHEKSYTLGRRHCGFVALAAKESANSVALAAEDSASRVALIEESDSSVVSATETPVSGVGLGETVTKRIEDIGFGTYQLQQATLVACYFLAEAAELDIISPLTSAWRLEWNLSRDAVAALASIGFAGFALGTFVSGFVGDRFGRRVPILAGYVGVLIGALGMWSAMSPDVVAVFRFIAGFSVGCGVPPALTIIAEVSPSQNRAVLINICYVALFIGSFFADYGLYMFTPDLKSGDWRDLCLWSALPAAVALPAGLAFLKDTPSYYASQGDYKNLDSVLDSMAITNGRAEWVERKIDWEHLAAQETVAPAARKESNQEGWLDPKLLAYLVPLVACALLDFAYNFVGFGVGYFFPLELSELPASSSIPPVGELVIANLIGVVGLVVASAAQSSALGHRQVLALAAIAEVLAVGFLLFVGTDAGYAAVGAFAVFAPLTGVLGLKLVEKTFSQTVNVVKGECFPSRFRVTALSISGTVGRTGALIAPALIEETRGTPGTAGEFSFFLTCLIAVVFFATSVAYATLPDTKGTRLID